MKVFNLQKLNGFRVIIALIVFLSLTLTPPQTPAHAQGAGCSTSSPVSAAYAMTVCLTDPANGAVLSGYAPVTATVSVTGANPGVQKLLFYLGGQYLLTDYTTAYTFILPTTKFVDGSRLLEVEAIMRDGFTSTRAALNVTFNNGISEPPVNTNTFTISTGSTPASGRPFILAATGDGASGEPNADAVANMIAGWNPNMFVYLGDVYDDGTFTEFYNWYGSGADRYSQFRAVTNPVVGNHEYGVEGAGGYFDYFDNVPHYYSFNAAGWHIINLDSTSQFGQTDPGTPQYDWLVADLTANTAICTIVNFHHPVYNIGPEGDATRMNQIWALLAQHGVDVVLTGHDHDYQRWQSLDGSGALASNGITQFVVGTGGHGIQDFVRTDSRVAVGFDTPPTAFGALRMELNPSGTAFQFVNTAGATLDSGSIQCSGAAADATSPSTPTNLVATASTATHVDLSWTSSTDNVGVTQYDIYRDGAWLTTTTTSAMTYTDDTVEGGTTYQYRIRARDASGNVSGLSNTATATATLLFSDGFESGDLSRWTWSTGLIVQQQEVYDGTYAVRQSTSGLATWAYKQLSVPQPTVYYRLRFKLISQSSNVYLLKFRTATGGSLMGVFVNSTGKLAYRNDTNSTTSTSTTNVTSGVWHDLEARVTIDGAASQTEVWLDDIRIDALSKTESLGTTPIGRLQIGDNSTGRSYDVAFDNVVVDINPIDMTPPSVALTEPLDNAVVKDSVFLAATASDNVSLSEVEFYANGVRVGTDYSAPYGVIWDSTTTSDGPVTIIARALDIGFNATTSTSRTVAVDNTPPNTVINSGPSGTDSSTSATFTFSSNEIGVSFLCLIDTVEIEGCTSPQTFNGLANGSHIFQVTATDGAGNTDPTPASRTWTVNTSGPTSTYTATASPTATATYTPTVTPTFTSTATSTPVTGPVTFTSVSDAYVNASSPASNYGSLTTLRADASPVTRSYLRFNVQGLTGSITNATLRVYANTASTQGYQVYGVSDNAWGETTINFNNAPVVGSLLGSSGSLSAGTWTTVNVTSYITGNGSFNLALTTPSSTAISFASREAGLNAPQLVIQTSDGSTLTPTFTPTVTFTSTPTATATQTGTSTPTNTAGPSPTPTNTALSNSFTFIPLADAYVNSGSPTTNYGSLTTLRADNSPVVLSYLRFDIQGLSGTMTQATLRIFTNSSSSAGYEVRTVASNSWNESTINYSNAPTYDAVTSTSGSFGAGVWTTVDVTPLVTGNGTFSIALTTTSSTAFSLASRESGVNAPQLIIETSP
jgi:hypothetical protein